MKRHRRNKICQNSNYSEDDDDIFLEVEVNERPTFIAPRKSLKLHSREMNHHENCMQVTIVEPVAKISAFDFAKECSKQSLSTIQECDSTGEMVLDSENFKLKLNHFLSMVQGKQSPQNFNHLFEIEQLLKYYATNSNMEKSIDKVLEETEKKRVSNYSPNPLGYRVGEDTKIDAAPSIELRAVFQIFHLLASSTKASPNEALCRDVLSAVQNLLSHCDKRKLEELLSNDPSMKVCQHCGVISCSDTRRGFSETQKSPPISSYFLNAQSLLDNAEYKELKAHREKSKYAATRDKFPKNLKNFEKVDSNAGLTDYGRKYNYSANHIPVEKNLSITEKNKTAKSVIKNWQTMVAERENEEKKFESVVSNELKGSSKIETKISAKYDVKIKNSNPFRAKPRDTKERGSEAIKLKNTSQDERQNERQNERFREPSFRDPAKFFETEEQILRFISYSSSLKGFHASENRSHKKMDRKINKVQEGWPVLPNSINSINDTVRYLADSPYESTARKQKDMVSQPIERTFVQSKFETERHSFMLHSGRDNEPQLDIEFRLCDEPTKQSQNSAPFCQCSDRCALPENERNSWRDPRNQERNFKESESYVRSRSMEMDSLENCIDEPPNKSIRAGESDTTAYSSSSAENMIREWVKPRWQNAAGNVCDRRSVTSKPSGFLQRRIKERIVKAIGRCVEFNSDDGLRDLRNDDSNDTRRSSSLRDQRKIRLTAKQTLSSNDNSKFERIIVNALENKSGVRNFSSEDLDDPGLCPRFDKLDKVPRSLKEVDSWIRKMEKGDFKATRETLHFLPSSRVKEQGKNNLVGSGLDNLRRRITYDESFLKDMLREDSGYAEIMYDYRKILEDAREMDWTSFQGLIENLHPSQKQLWRDVCRAVSNEARRLNDKIGGSTEVCIEISPLPRGECKKEPRVCSNEIVFEMDMTLLDVERFLGKKLASTERPHLDTHKL